MDPAHKLAAALIRTYEGVKLEAYQDTGGVWTIGFGHTGPEVVKGLTISYDLAVEFYAQDSAPLFALVPSKPPAARAALVSFAYNCGRTALEQVLAGTADMSRYIHDRHGNELDWLVKRRDVEMALIAL